MQQFMETSPSAGGGKYCGFRLCISSLMKSNVCENRAAQQPHTIYWCSGQPPPLWQQTRFYWKGHLQTQENIFLSLWPLHLSCEWSCGLTGLGTLAWARMALCHTRDFPSFLKKTPITSSNPSYSTVEVFRPRNTTAPGPVWAPVMYQEWW